MKNLTTVIGALKMSSGIVFALLFVQSLRIQKEPTCNLRIITARARWPGLHAISFCRGPRVGPHFCDPESDSGSICGLLFDLSSLHC